MLMSYFLSDGRAFNEPDAQTESANIVAPSFKSIWTVLAIRSTPSVLLAEGDVATVRELVAQRAAVHERGRAGFESACVPGVNLGCMVLGLQLCVLARILV